MGTKKKLPEIIEKATQQAVAETRREDFARFKRFCEKHGITWTEEELMDQVPERENS